jgi:uncharacterized protein (DUF58 family)
MQPVSLQQPSNGAYCAIADLIQMRHPAQKLDLRQRRRALSLLAGSSKANFRGRGIDFEEVRSYQPGDDIRTIDWRVTARTGDAHTKLFREERERPVLVVVDQRSSMFFGSEFCCKSVLAAHFGALLAWSALGRGDRVGGLVFNEHEHRETRPRRSRRSVLALLHNLDELNRSLPLPPAEQPLQFTGLLSDLRRIAKPGSAVFLISDFSGALETRALEHLYQLSRHTEITALHCADKLEAELPARGNYTVTDGSQRARLFTGNAELRRRYREHFSERLARLHEEYGKLGIPVLEAGTHDSPLARLQSVYGDNRRTGRRS